MARKVKTQTKIFTSDLNYLEKKIIQTMDKISGIVGASLGPNGRNILIESELPEIPNKNTKDGVSIFRSLGANDPYEHLIIEQTRDAAIRTVNEAGDGTTTATVISSALIKNLFNFCGENRKYSPQRVTRIINKLIKEKVIPNINESSIKVKTIKDRHLLEKVATVSVNGDTDMAKSVMEAFELTGFSSASHVTIQELSGPSGVYEVKLIEGFPINKGYEESIGKFHAAFINDQANQRCLLEKPLFILFDGNITDVLQIGDILQSIGERYVSGEMDFKNVVIMAHNFSDSVLTWLAFNFPNPNTINVVPLTTPIDGIANAQLQFLMDVSAFTGAKIFDMHNPLSEASPDDFGKNVEKIEIYRFRATIVGEPDELNIQSRADEIRKQIAQSESKLEKIILEERVGKLTNGIAQLRIYGSSNGELKEKADRAEDAVCAVRAAINHGCLPGGCRALINQVIELNSDRDPIVQKVVIPSLMAPFFKLLDNAGYNEEEVQEILMKLFKDKDLVFNVETAEFGKAKDMGVFDATLAVTQALGNACSIASVMGTLGGIVCTPRDMDLERQEFLDNQNFEKTLENAESFKNEANVRP
jgi:chaperonin GroEL